MIIEFELQRLTAYSEVCTVAYRQLFRWQTLDLLAIIPIRASPNISNHSVPQFSLGADHLSVRQPIERQVYVIVLIHTIVIRTRRPFKVRSSARRGSGSDYLETFSSWTKF